LPSTSRGFVGHSLGAVIAGKSGKPSRGIGPYALPGLRYNQQQISHSFDPVTLFARGHRFGFGHSLESYADDLRSEVPFDSLLDG
jgi:hypothetical protein